MQMWNKPKAGLPWGHFRFSHPIKAAEICCKSVFQSPGRHPAETFRHCFSADILVKLTDVFSLALPDLRPLTWLWKMCWTVTNSRTRWSQGAEAPVFGRKCCSLPLTHTWLFKMGALRIFAFMPRIAEHLSGIKAFPASFQTSTLEVFPFFNSQDFILYYVQHVIRQ